jgi:predicted membrane protein
MKKDRKFVAAIGFLIVGLLLLPWTSEAVSVYTRIPVLFSFPLMIFNFVGASLLAIYILLLLSPFMFAGALLLDCREK